MEKKGLAYQTGHHAAVVATNLFLSLAYVSKDQNYELPLAKFTAGYTYIMQQKSFSPDEHAGCLDHFVDLMYLVTQLTWHAIPEFHI